MNETFAHPRETGSEKAKVDQLLNTFRDLRVKWQEKTTASEKSFNYLIGKIFSDTVRKQLDKDGRPYFEFQLILQFVLYLTGKIKRDTRKFKASPTQPSDVEAAELHTALNEYSMEVSGGYQETAKAATDAIIGSTGWVNCYYTYQDDPEGIPCVKREDPFLIFKDPMSRMSNQSDMRYLLYAPMMTAEEIIRTYQKYLTPEMIEQIKRKAEEYEGQYKEKGKPVSWFDKIGSFLSGRVVDRPQAGTIDPELINAKEGIYRVIEGHDRRITIQKILYSPMSREFEIFDDTATEEEITQKSQELKTLPTGEQVSRFPMPQVMHNIKEEIWVSVAVPCLLPEDLIFELPHPIQGRGFQFKEIKGYDFHPDETKVQSIVDPLKAPVEFFVQRIATSLELLMDEVNPPIDYPDGSIKPENLDDWKSKTRGLLRKYFHANNGQKPEPRRSQASAFQMASVLADESKNMLDNSFGIGLNARGQQESSGESGKLFDSRTAQTEVMISHIFDNILNTQKEIFRYVDKMNQTFMPMNRMIRILGDSNDPTWLVVNQQTLEGVKNDIRQGEFDFKPDVLSLGETARKEAIQTLVQVAPLISFDPIVAGAIGVEVLRNLDIAAGKKLADFAEQRLGIAQMREQQAQMIQQQQVQQQADSHKLQMAGEVKALTEPSEKKAA